MFVRRKHKEEKVEYLHPDLEPILKETYGVIVYQEQVMQILVKIGGYTYAEADNIRRFPVFCIIKQQVAANGLSSLMPV